MSFHVPEQHRIVKGPMASNESYGNNGAFTVPLRNGETAHVVASDGLGWEHVSISLEELLPNWDEMCEVKAIFWDDEDCVVQYHPPKSEHVNLHPYCLHLWRPTAERMPIPPRIMVGPKRRP